MPSQQDNVIDFSSRATTKTPEPSDAEMLLAFVNGDQKALGDFYERHQDELENFAMRKMNYHKADAEDVVMNVIEKLLTMLLNTETGGEAFIFEKFGETGSARSYMFSMVSNKAIDTYRSNKVREAASLDNRPSDGEQSLPIEIADTHTADEACALELDISVRQNIWASVSGLQQELSDASYQIDKKRLEKHLTKATKEAVLLETIYDLRSLEIGVEEIAREIGMDRKTLQKRRNILAEINIELLPAQAC